ncbi:MAG: hypothetical protein Q8P82_00740 [bacterium]|nr:hypothetical protein [bacterium]
MDSKLFFILGREPALSVAEIFAVLERELGHAEAERIAGTAEASTQILKIDVPQTLDPKRLMEQLGGTIKIGIILNTIPIPKNDEEIEQAVSQAILQIPALKGIPRIRFGISLYHASFEPIVAKTFRHLVERMRIIGIHIKRSLEESGFRVRWVVAREPVLSSVIVKTNRLLTEGAEIILSIQKDSISIGHTITVQPFEELEKRDYGRPGRDTRMGMLPPKLARMMVNLAAVPFTATILDPFCGTGTVLAESLLLGYRSLIGTDLDPKAIEKTRQNFAWLKEKQYAPPEVFSDRIQVFQHDVRNLDRAITTRVDAVVTEPDLGPPLRGNEPRAVLERTHNELVSLYRSALTAFSKILRPGGRVVMVFPLVRMGKTIFPSTVPRELSQLGFIPLMPIPKSFPLPRSYYAEFGGQGNSLIYGRADQKVWREIVILERST